MFLFIVVATDMLKTLSQGDLAITVPYDLARFW
jgi:hypothetical protein